MKNERAMYAISYGLFVLTARQGERDNGCIINTAVQVTAQRPSVLSAFFGKLTRNLSLDRWRRERAAKRGGGEMELHFRLRESPEGVARIETELNRRSKL